MTHAIVIDFETANGSPSSVCSVGIVIVRDGEVVDSFYSLIHPYPDYYAWFCQQVHGLGPDDTEDAPLFPDVWDQVEDRILASFGQPSASRLRSLVWIIMAGLRAFLGGISCSPLSSLRAFM